MATVLLSVISFFALSLGSDLRVINVLYNIEADSWIHGRSSVYFFSLLTLLAVLPRRLFSFLLVLVSQIFGCSSFHCFSLITLLALWPQKIQCLKFTL